MRRTYKCCKNKWQLRLINKTLRIWRVKPQDAFTTRPIDNCIAVSNVPVLVNWQRFSTTEHVLYDAVTRHLNTAFTLLFTVESLLKICGFGARVSYGGGGPRPLTGTCMNDCASQPLCMCIVWQTSRVRGNFCASRVTCVSSDFTRFSVHFARPNHQLLITRHCTVG